MPTFGKPTIPIDNFIIFKNMSVNSSICILLDKIDICDIISKENQTGVYMISVIRSAAIILGIFSVSVIFPNQIFRAFLWLREFIMNPKVHETFID